VDTVQVRLIDFIVLAYQKKGDRDESIQTLASFMRDMLASLSEVKDLSNIEMLQSVIKIAVTCVDECAEFY
jgi:hypothetical protein